MKKHILQENKFIYTSLNNKLLLLLLADRERLSLVSSSRITGYICYLTLLFLKKKKKKGKYIANNLGYFKNLLF